MKERDYNKQRIETEDRNVSAETLKKNLRAYLRLVAQGMPESKDIDLIRAAMSLLHIGNKDAEAVVGAMDKYCVEYSGQFAPSASINSIHVTSYFKGYEFSLMPDDVKKNMMNRYSQAVIGSPLTKKTHSVE